MGAFVLLHLGLWFSLSCLISSVYSSEVLKKDIGTSSSAQEGFVFIDGGTAIGSIDKDFICATMDWWPPEKCDYGTCSWDHSSFLNLVTPFSFFLFCFAYFLMSFWFCLIEVFGFLTCCRILTILFS